MDHLAFGYRGILAPMLLIVLAMLVVLSLALVVTAAVALPTRGEPVPHAAWLSDQLTRLRRRIEP